MSRVFFAVRVARSQRTVIGWKDCWALQETKNVVVEEDISSSSASGVPSCYYQLQRVIGAATVAGSDSLMIPQHKRSSEPVEKTVECEQTRTSSQAKDDFLMRSRRIHVGSSYHGLQVLSSRSFTRALSSSSQVLAEKAVEEMKFEEVLPAESSLEEEEASLGKYELDDIHDFHEGASEAIGEQEGEFGKELGGVSLQQQRSPDESQQTLWWKFQKAKLGPKKSIIPLVTKWMAEGRGLDKRGLINTMSRLRKMHRYRQALEISDWMVDKEGIEWGEMDHVVRIELKAKMGQFNEAESLFRTSPPEFKTQQAYHALLRGYVGYLKSEKAEALFAELKASGLLTHSLAFNQMLLLYKRKRVTEKIPKLLEEMTTLGVARDIYTYNILMDWKAQTGDIVGMEQLFQELKADEVVRPDAATYGILASTYVKSGDSSKAKVFLQEMEQGNVIRRRAAYDILIAQYGTLGDYKAVERVWAKSKSLPGNSTSTYVVMLEALGKLGKVERAEEIYKALIHEKGIVLAHQYNAMLSVYTRQGLMEKAETVIGEMGKIGRKRNAITFHHLVSGYLKNMQLDKALETVAQAKAESTTDDRTKLWLETMLAVLEACAQKGDVVRAEQHFQELRKLYPKVGTQQFNMLLKAYIVGGVPASGFLQRMQLDNVFADDETLSLLKQVVPSDHSEVSQQTV
jgi:pentatricopeptide repeat protein